MPQPALQPALLPFSLLLPGSAGDLFQFDTPMWMTRAPAVFQVIGGAAEQTGSATFHVALSRAVYSAIQNREDDEIHIRLLAGGEQGQNLDWSGKISDIYTKKGPPRSLAVLEGLFEEAGTPWMMRMMATMIGLRRTHQLNTPKFGFSLVVWSRLPESPGFGAEIAQMTSVGMALKASTGLDKKRVDGVRVARAMVHGAKEVLDERLSLADALTCALAEQHTGMFIEHGLDPSMQWAPISDQSFVGAVDLGLGELTDEATRRAAQAGPMMGMAHLNRELKKQKEPLYGGWGQVAPKDFEGGLRSHVPARENGRDWLAAFAKKEEEVAVLVDEDRPYRERALAEHEMRETGRVHRFVEQMTEYARTKREDHLAEAGKVLASSHRSLRDKASVQAEEVDEFLARLQDVGRDAGLFGAKLAGTGAGSIVAVLGHQAGEEKLRATLEAFTAEYELEYEPNVYLETARGAAMTGWWEGVLQPKEDTEAEKAAASAD